jgi:hypothetical protein
MQMAVVYVLLFICSYCEMQMAVDDVIHSLRRMIFRLSAEYTKITSSLGRGKNASDGRAGARAV